MAISEQIQQKITELKPHYPTEQALLIPLLHEVQQEKGWISCQSMREIGDYLHLPLSKVKEVVSFYTMFNQEPVGKFHLQLCNNLSCWLSGSEQLLHRLEQLLAIKVSETTADGLFTLTEVECLASCGTAPVLQVNDRYYENLTVPELEKLVATLRQRAQVNDLSLGAIEPSGI